MGDKIVNEQTEAMDEMEILLTSLGDEPITLMDQYERLSFEVQLNRAILGRSLSESNVQRARVWPKPISLPPPLSQAHQGPKQRRPRGVGFGKVLKRLLKPIFVRGSRNKEVTDAKVLKTWKAFGKSMRV